MTGVQKPIETRVLPRLPSHLPNPRRPLHHIFSLYQQINTEQILRQFFIGSNLVHIRVTRSTKPRNFCQLPLAMPPSLDSLCVHLPWYQMMIRQRELLSATNLTPVRARGRERGCVFGGCSCDGRNVGVEDEFEETVEIRCVVYQAVGGQGVRDAEWQRFDDGFQHGGIQWRLILGRK